jgi:transposase
LVDANLQDHFRERQPNPKELELELNRLRKENMQLLMENDILKQAKLILGRK